MLVALLATTAQGFTFQNPTSPTTRRTLVAGVGAALATTVTGASARAEESSKPQFKRLSPIQFIAALGDPQASSGVGAEKWGLWREDPGPRGVFLRDYEKKLAAKGGMAPAGWTMDPSNFYVEEHGLIMEVPAPLPLSKFERDGAQMRTLAPEKKYIVTGGRETQAVLTVHADGRWELSKGTLYDVTHLPCRTGVYTPTTPGSCKPLDSMQSKFPVKPGALMPTFDGCNTQVRPNQPNLCPCSAVVTDACSSPFTCIASRPPQDWWVLFVLGVEV